VGQFSAREREREMPLTKATHDTHLDRSPTKVFSLSLSFFVIQF